MRSRTSLLAVFAAALLLTLLQLLLASVAISPSGFWDFLHALTRWDGDWYISIAEHGYRSTIPPVAQNWNVSNVAFFPGYPLAVRLTHAVTGVDFRTSLLIAAHLACIGFWTYLLLLCREWNVSAKLQALVVFLILAYPGAYFLIVGQSESLFLFALLGYVYWTNKKGRRAYVLAAVHGFLASATRLVGMIVALYPLLRISPIDESTSTHSGAFVSLPAPRRKKSARHWTRASSLAFATALGGILFFVYCFLQFGAWDLYMQTERIGWNVTPKPFAFLDGSLYQITRFPLWQGTQLDAIGWNRFLIPVLLFLFAAFIAMDAFTRIAALGAHDQRSGLIPIGLMMIAVSLSRPENFMRFGLPPYIFLVLAFTHFLSQTKSRKWKPWLLLPLGALSCMTLLLQMTLAYRFGHQMWI